MTDDLIPTGEHERALAIINTPATWYEHHYLTTPQLDVLLQPIRPNRVGNKQGKSHVESYEIRAHLNRMFGFARWSSEVIDQQMVYETSEIRTRRRDGRDEEYEAWDVMYRSLLRLTIRSRNGTELAVYTEGATGDATNYSSRADAHDNALKTSESQALKRCAINLGDQFGLGLYKKGSMDALVGQVLPLAWPEGGQAADPSAHIQETPPEDERFETEQTRETSTGPELPPPADPDQALVETTRAQILAGPPPDKKPNTFYAEALRYLREQGWLGLIVANRDGEPVTFKAFVDHEMIARAKT